METVNEDRHIYFYNLREIPADLEEAGRRVLKAFDVRERFFHFEFFRSRPDGRVVALEVNMRPPGGPIIDMYNYAHDDRPVLGVGQRRRQQPLWRGLHPQVPLLFRRPEVQQVLFSHCTTR